MKVAITLCALLWCVTPTIAAEGVFFSDDGDGTCSVWIIGGANADEVNVYGEQGNLIAVSLNGDTTTYYLDQYSSCTVYAFLYGGNDKFSDLSLGFVDPADQPVYVVYGHGGADTISTGDQSDTVYGGDGNDTISTRYGTDAIDAGAGADTIRSGAGVDIVDGGTGTDVLDQGGGSGDARVNCETVINPSP